MQAGRWVRICR